MSKTVSNELLDLIGKETDPKKIVAIARAYDAKKKAEEARLNGKKKFIQWLGINTRKVSTDTLTELAYDYVNEGKNHAAFKQWLNDNRADLFESRKKKDTDDTAVDDSDGQVNDNA